MTCEASPSPTTGKCTLSLPVSSPAPSHSLSPCGPTPGYCCFTKIKEPPAP
ncbi:hypothetical protein MEO_05704 [Candida albicans P94015]|nr:hypothetical protein MEO_05704 [Candida albicans P94015]